MHVLNLPEEVLLTILSHLDARDLVSFASVSRYTKEFYESSSRLQYIAELDLAGCLDLSLNASCASSRRILANSSSSSSSSLSDSEESSTIAEKLDYLRTREARWRALDLLQNARSIPLDHPTEVSIYDLSAGVFAFAELEQEELLFYVELREVSRRGVGGGGKGKARAGMGEAVPSVTGGTQLNVNADANVTAEDLDEVQNGPVSLPPTDVPLQTFPFHGSVADFGLALREHDLIVLVSYNPKDQGNPLNLPSMQEIKLNLYEFSTRQPHPLAKETVLKLTEKPATYWRPSPAIEISGKYVVIVLTFPRAMVDGIIDDLFVINWQTGRVIYHSTYDTFTYCSLAFVTPSLFVIPNMIENTLDLVHIFAAPDGVERVCWLRKLCLPELTNHFKLRSSVCRGDPNPTEDTPDILNPNSSSKGRSTTYAKGKRWGAGGYGITADPLRAIISFKFIIVHEDIRIPNGPSINVVMHRSALASLALNGLEERKQAVLQVGADSKSVETEVPVTEWREWGPKATRWRLEDDYVEWVTTTAGQRQVFVALSSDNPWRPIIYIRDYNPHEVRRMKARAKHAGGDERIYVDSVHGERASDSEDEDEFGLGEHAWAVEDDAATGNGNGNSGDNNVEAGGEQPLVDEPGNIVTEMHDVIQEFIDDGNANAGAGPHAHMDAMVSEGLAAFGGTPAELEALLQQAIDGSTGNPNLDPNPNHQAYDYHPGSPIPALPSLTAGVMLQPYSAVSPSTSVTALSSPSRSHSPHPLDDFPARPPSLKRTSIRVRDTLATPSVRYYKKDEPWGGLPCVEYVVEGNEYLYTGLLMDEERIIGYLESEDNPQQVEKMLQMSVFSMYP